MLVTLTAQNTGSHLPRIKCTPGPPNAHNLLCCCWQENRHWAHGKIYYDLQKQITWIAHIQHGSVLNHARQTYIHFLGGQCKLKPQIKCGI